MLTAAEAQAVQRLIRGHWKCPAYLSMRVSYEKEEMLLQVIKNGRDQVEWEVQILRDIFWAQRLSMITRQLAHDEVTDTVMVVGHEAQHCC